MSAPATPKFHRWNIEVRLESQQNTLTARASIQIPLQPIVTACLSLIPSAQARFHTDEACIISCGVTKDYPSGSSRFFLSIMSAINR